MKEEESDLSFAEFGGSKRLYPAPGLESNDTEAPNYLESMARREGLASERSSRCLVGLRPTETPDPQVRSLTPNVSRNLRAGQENARRPGLFKEATPEADGSSVASLADTFLIRAPLPR